MENYFKTGDEIKCPSIWGDRVSFTITGVSGDSYCPMLYCKFNGKEESRSNCCNIDARDAVLVGAIKRPMRSVDQAVLLKMISKHITEAKREFLIRKHKC